ncbi:glycosyltransferase [Candidatus Nitrotoga sp. 1052]|uniref:glycosyltransferase n=1 Tax=Candidatus Nitrotoga sp. 1052 TaxID=2886964 RepID=UPI001F84D96A|nr:glycosyltransferase [Candidatus Nitrotoga sp. 1052]CAH1070199.1 Glycosyl transferase family 2 [Candidatus Nitrotoga sp. 1052]
MSPIFSPTHFSQETLAVHPGNQPTLPLVSVIVRSMGRPELHVALESIARQDYPNVEVIVVDATGGNHPTLPVIAWQSGHSIRIVGGHRRLLRPQAANEGLQAVHGEWFCFLDDDDTYDFDFLSAMLSASREYPEALLVYGRARMLDEHGNVKKLFGSPFNRAMMYYGPLFYWQAAIIRRKVIVLGCCFDETFEICEDRDFLHQIAEHCDFVFVPVVGFNYRPDLGTSGTGPGANRDRPRILRSENQLRAKWANASSYHTRRLTEMCMGAVRAFHDGNFTLSRALFDKTLDTYPDDPSALHGLARLGLHDGQLATAEKLARRAIEINPSAAEFCMTMALILEASHKYEEALEFVWRARINPTFQAGADELAQRISVISRAKPLVQSSVIGVSLMNAPSQELRDSQEIEKFLLCRPHGGLNDTLCQIEQCWRYAEKFGRTLIIDTLNSGLLAEFSEFFSPRNSLTKVHFSLSEEQLCFLNTLTCFPHSVQGKLRTYFAVYSIDSKNCVDRETTAILTFNFDKNYDELVLIHEQSGGGDLSFDLLNRISISENIRPIVLDRIQHLGHDYFAVHVRNTDYQTQYKDLFLDIYSSVTNKSLLVCSDDAEVISHARSFFTLSKILISSQTPQTGNKPLHYSATHSDDEQRKKATINSIIDLIALGRSTKLYFANVTAGHSSGFSKLAMHLCQNKYVIDALLKLDTSTPSSTSPKQSLQFSSKHSIRWC